MLAKMLDAEQKATKMAASMKISPDNLSFALGLFAAIVFAPALHGEPVCTDWTLNVEQFSGVSSYQSRGLTTGSDDSIVVFANGALYFYDSARTRLWKTGVAGGVIGRVTYDIPQTFIYSTGPDFVAKHNLAGVQQWKTIYSGNTHTDVAAMPSGHVVTSASWYNGSRNVGRLTKWDSSGNSLWSKEDSPGTAGWHSGLAVDSSGNIYAGGHFNQAPAVYSRLIKTDSDGNTIWVRNYKPPEAADSQAYGHSVTMDSMDNPVITGQFIVPYGERGIFATKYDGSGNTLWSSRVLGWATAYGSSVASNGDVLVVGSKMGNGTVSAVMFDQNGIQKWEYPGVGEWNAEGAGAAFLSDGTALALGVDSKLVHVLGLSARYCAPEAVTSLKNESESFVFPDPVDGGKASLGFVMPGSGKVEVVIFNSAGNAAARFDESRFSGPQTLEFSVDKFARGVYFYVIKGTLDSGESKTLSTGKFRVKK